MPEKGHPFATKSDTEGILLLAKKNRSERLYNDLSPYRGFLFSLGVMLAYIMKEDKYSSAVFDIATR